MFVMKFFNSTVPSMKNLQPDDVTFLARVNSILQEYINHMENCCLREGIRSVLGISRLGNGYLQAQKPWVLYKSSDTMLEPFGLICVDSDCSYDNCVTVECVRVIFAASELVW